MLRNARVIAPLLRALVLGGLTAAALGASATVVVGCADESQPETWVKRLDDPVTRPAAIKRLVQFFEDAMTRANKDRTDANVKALLDKIVEPLSKTYVDGALDERTRIELIKFLADTRDPRSKAALIKACAGFAQGKDSAEDDVRWAAPSIAALKLDEAAPALGDAFVKLQAGTQKGSQAYKNVGDAMLTLKSPAWKPLLLERINRPMERPSGANDSAKVAPFQNEQFWQVTAAQILGDLRAAEATRPLLKIVMDPQKADVAATASMALIKIGKDAVPALIAAMNGADKEIVDYAASHSGGDATQAKSYVRAAAVALGAIGRKDAVAPMIQALAAADNDTTRYVLASELTKLPSTPESEKAFQDAFDKVGPSTLTPLGDNARSGMMDAIARFYDPQLVPWLLKQIKDAKGSENDKNVVQTGALVASIKLMTKAQMPDVQKAVDKEGTQIEKDAFKLAADLLNACGDTVACYLSKIQEPASQAQATQFTGLKSGYMIGILGNAGTSAEIVKVLPKVRNAAVRFSAGQAIDHLSQADAGPIADALQKIVDENKAKDDKDMMRADEGSVKTIVFRLRAR